MIKYYLLLLLYSCVTVVQAQTVTPQTVNVTGGFINTGYYQLEWSVGEASIIETFDQPNIILTNGILQPYTDKITPGIQDNSWDVSEIKIFPSPTKGNFEVNIMTKQQGILEVQLVDNLGQVLRSFTDSYFGIGRIIRFDISRNASSNYFLRINLSPNPGFSKKKGSFKILKIN